MPHSFTNEMQIHFCISIKVVDDNNQCLVSARIQMRNPFSPQSCFQYKRTRIFEM